ncbi:aspartate/glutamate racemase family protein [Candidatus Giovannonibacteria bacterium]|nr:aspartate/glutamate racemase family protein [Candidatus Giovannonibacteria bacterium]
MKTIGVIGGLGPQATIDFESRIHTVSQKLIKQYANRGYPPLVVYYLREAPMILAKDGSTPKNLEPEPKLLEAAKTLGAIADFLVIASNTPHFFQEQIEAVSGKKVLSIVEVTLEEVKRRGLKKVGILAIGDTLKHQLYQNRLEQIGVAWEIPDKKVSRALDKAIWAVMEGRKVGRFAEEPRHAAERGVTNLRYKQVKSIILGCTELPLLLGHWIKTSRDLINPNQLLAEAAVKCAIS